MSGEKTANNGIDVCSPLWDHALTLEERAACMEDLPGDLGADTERIWAETKVREWCTRRFVDEQSFEKRLSIVGLTLRSLQQLLITRRSPVLYREKETAKWIKDMSVALSLPKSRWRTISESHRDPTVPFARAIAPLLANAVEQIFSGARHLQRLHHAVPFDVASVAQLFVPHMIATAEETMTPTLVLEMWKAKERGDLMGTDSKTRFENFVESMCSPGAIRNLFEQYPVLGRLVMEGIAHSTECALEFMERASSDWPSVRDHFLGGDDPGPIERLDVAGDRHGQSRSVLVVTCASHARVVYKPRSQSIAQHFQQLLSWLNERDPELRLRTISFLSRGAYGWCEFVERKECESTDHVARFYERQGFLLGILYVFGGSDIHQENIIAAGDQPVLVDVEGKR